MNNAINIIFKEKTLSRVYLSELKKLVKDLKIENKVEFVGLKTKEEVHTSVHRYFENPTSSQGCNYSWGLG